jgi:hypothetical protein
VHASKTLAPKTDPAHAVTRYALIVSKNASRARRIASVLSVGGLTSETVEEPANITKTIAARQERPSIFCSAEELNDVLAAIRDHAALDVFAIISDQEQPDVFGTAGKVPQIMGVIGLRTPDGLPRSWEILQMARRLTVGKVPPPSAPLSWGHSWYEHTLSGLKDRDELIEQVRTFCSDFQTPRQASATSQLADELMMNAMYDAPVDEHGKERYAHNRNKAIELEARERPTFGFGCDGSRIAITIADPFGRLPKGAVFGGIHRGLTTGKMDTRGGGAGLGMLLIHHAAKVLFFDVVPGRRTQVTAVIELDLSPAEFRKMPGSVHFFVHRPPV